MSTRNAVVGGSTDPISLAPHVQITEFDNSLSANSLLVRTRNRHIQVDGTARLLLLFLINQQGPVSAERLASGFLRESGGEVTSEYVEQLLDRLAGLGVLASAGSGRDPESAPVVPDKPRKRSYFLFRIPLLPAVLVQKVCRILAPLTSPWLLFTVTPALMVVQAVIWRSTLIHSGITVRSLRPQDLMIFVVGNYFGLLLHEFGHAAACFRAGEKPGHIGLGVYLLFPVFYTDVSRAWALSRKDRLAVDIAGLYMSLALAFVASMMFFLHGGNAWVLLATAYSITVIACLNPFIKMDGYWFLSDLLGIPNLMNANREMSQWLFWRGLRKKSAQPKILQLSGVLKVTYLIYYALFAIFISYVSARLALSYLPHIVRILPALYGQMSETAARSGVSWLLVRLFLQMLLRLLPLALSCIYVIRFAKRIAAKLSFRAVDRRERATAIAPMKEVS
jgi:putative peptide zinc metalloprotease protein